MGDATVGCMWCGGRHTGMWCPLVKSFEFYDIDQGKLKRVEFFAPIDYHKPEPKEEEQDYPRLKSSRE